MFASFCTNAWICALVRQVTVESFNVNAWICEQSTTDRDLESFNVNA